MRVRVSQIFRAELEGFLSTHSVPPVVGRAARAIVNCRTAVLGGHAEACRSGHVRVWYNACRSRCCPRCAFYRVQRWLERQARTLLGCAHHHVIFTVPHELNPLWLLNQAALGELLFRAARGALFTLAADPRYLGGVPGAIMALHTWGQQLALHPHVHCLVTAGGVDSEGLWRPCRRRHFLPAEPLKRLFRAKFVDELLALLPAERLRLPDGWTEVDPILRTRKGRGLGVACSRCTSSSAVVERRSVWAVGAVGNAQRFPSRCGRAVRFARPQRRQLP